MMKIRRGAVLDALSVAVLRSEHMNGDVRAIALEILLSGTPLA
jgi:hypothetical protein